MTVKQYFLPEQNSDNAQLEITDKLRKWKM